MRLAALGVLVLVFAVAGCGGSSDSTSTPTASSEATDSDTSESTAAEEVETTDAETGVSEDVDPDVQAVIETTEEVYGAILSGDAETFCGLATASFTVKMKALTGAGGDCEEVIAEPLEKLPSEQIKQEERELEELGPDNVVIKGDEAIVTFPEEEMILIRSGDHWLHEGSHNR